MRYIPKQLEKLVLDKSGLILETAIGNDKVMQDFDLESLQTEDSFTIRECSPSVGRGSKSKSCITLSFPIAVSRLMYLLFSFFLPIFAHSVPEPLPDAPPLILYYSPGCPYSQKVLRCLQKMNQTIPMKNVQTDPAAKEELRRYGGKMQVPCLFINGHPLYESQDIIDWLIKANSSNPTF